MKMFRSQTVPVSDVIGWLSLPTPEDGLITVMGTTYQVPTVWLTFKIPL